MKKKSLFFYLLASFLLIITLILLALWLLQTVFLSTFYEKMKINEIHKIGAELIESYNNGGDAFIDTADRVAYRNSIRIHLLNESGKTIYYSNDHSFLSKELGKTPPDFFELQNELSNTTEKSMDRITHTPEGQKKLVYFTALKIGRYLYISTPIVPMDSTVNILRTQLLYISLIALFVSTIVAFYLARHITKPIVLLAQDARAFSKGDDRIRFQQKHFREIESLSDTLNQVAEDLASLEKLRNDLVANVSHDLRTPLTIIKSHAELVRDISWKEADKREKHLAIIIEESEKLTNLVNEILDVSKLRTEIILESVNLSQLVESVLTRFSKEERKVDVNIKERLFVKGNPIRLEQVIYNLLSNAIQHGDGKIELKLYPVSRHGSAPVARCEIFNQGNPLDNVLKDRIWHRYYRADSDGINPEQHNTAGGLGLSIVREILVQHRADYGVDSMTEGNVFWFELDMQTFT